MKTSITGGGVFQVPWILGVVALVSCRGGTSECNADSHCHFEDGVATCDPGFDWEHPEDGQDFSCINPQDVSGTTRELDLCATYLASIANHSICMEYSDTYGDLELSGDALAYACRPGMPGNLWAKKLLRAVSEGRVQVDWGQAALCRTKSRALRAADSPLTLATTRHADWVAIRDGVCSSFYRGLKGAGEACVESWDCAADLGCFTTAPFAADTLTCMKLGQVGEPCSNTWRPCDKGLSCNSDTDHCVALKANGTACSSSSDCASGYCATVCQDLVTSPLGGTCSSSRPCDPTLDCVTCRTTPTSSITTCETLGALGERCSSSTDCAQDLSCLNGTCSTLTGGASCQVGSTNSRCAPGATCVSATACERFLTQTECGQSSECSWQSNACAAVSGRCGVLPTSGTCLYGHACDARVSVCLASSNTCVPYAGFAESCTTTSTSVPACGFGLACVSGTCQHVCGVADDCNAGEYCDVALAVPACVPYRLTSCTADTQCPADTYCATCATLSTMSVCTGARGCEWNSSNNTCATACADIDSYNCSYTGGCQWSASTSACVPLTTPSFGCTAKLEIGIGCLNNSQCTSDYCTTDDANVRRCAQPVQGCAGDETSGVFLQTAFLFGAVLCRPRRRRS